MGARANIRMKYVDGDVCIYSHWGGEELRDVLKGALSKRMRWNDPPYLGRIIFCHVIAEDVLGENGFGLSPNPGEEEYKTIVVDMENQMVDDMSFELFVSS